MVPVYMKYETNEELLRPGKREVGPGYHLAPLLIRMVLIGLGAIVLVMWAIVASLFS